MQILLHYAYNVVYFLLYSNGGYVYIANKDMSDIFRVVSIDEIYLTKYNAEELKQFFKDNYGVELEEYGFAY